MENTTIQNNVIDTEKLRRRCVSSVEDYKRLGLVTETEYGPYIYMDRGAGILGVAHLDTVIDTPAFSLRGSEVVSPQLDDRLGAYVILDVLPSLGVDCDVLLTTGEETGLDSARFFTPSKEYNWMFSFDRAGEDVVMYMYQDRYTTKILQSLGWKVAYGSRSDISHMTHLGIKGFNFGVGYHLPHLHLCYADVTKVLAQVLRFKKFYSTYKNTRMEHVNKDRA